MQDFIFSKDFMWGTATAAHQVEGNNINNESWVMEHVPGNVYVEPSGDAIDHYHRYPTDIALLAKLGFTAYRFSIEWARIEPEEGEFSTSELEHYRRMLAACHEHGIKPMLTYHHFTSPRWLLRNGGWLDKKTPDKFALYCERVTAHLGDLIHVACTMNEPNIALIISKLMPVEIKDMPWWENAAKAFGVTPDKFGPWQFSTQMQAREIIMASHRKAYEVIHSGRGNFPVGLTLAMHDIQSVEGGDIRAQEIRHELLDYYLEQLRGDDFVGVQTYARMVVGKEGIVPPAIEVEKNQMGEEFYPEALEGTIRYAAKVAGIPVIVTENGFPTEDDSRRLEYLQRAVKCVANCLKDGLDVRGYFCWSAFDNFEWVSGYGAKFGVIAVDRVTQERTPKPSAHWLGSLAQSNRLENQD